MKPSFTSSDERIISIKTIDHKVDKDSLEVIIDSLEGWFELQRFSNGVFVDKTMFEGKGLDELTTVKFHIPKSIFLDNSDFTINITELIMGEPFDDVTWDVNDPTTWV